MKSRHIPIVVFFATFLIYGIFEPVAEAKQPPLAQEPESKTISVQFPGGSVNKYVASLKNKEPKLNVVVDKRAGEIPMPPFALKQVSLTSAVQLIAMITAAQEQRLVVKAMPHDRGRVGNDVFLISMSPTPVTTQQQPATPRRKLRVFSIRERQGNRDSQAAIKPETILSAVKFALRIQSSNRQEKPKIEFHSDSGLLMVLGTSDQLGVVDQVIGEVRRGSSITSPIAPVRQLQK